MSSGEEGTMSLGRLAYMTYMQRMGGGPDFWLSGSSAWQSAWDATAEAVKQAVLAPKVESAPTVELLYALCDNSTCEGKGTYDLLAQCYNCGTRYVVRLTKGHESKSSLECPHCGVSRRWSWMGSAEVAKALNPPAREWVGGPSSLMSTEEIARRAAKIIEDIEREKAAE